MNTVLTIKALEDGVSVIFTSQENSPCLPTQRLDRGEVLIIASPDKGDGIRVRGHAEVYTPHHVLKSESGLVIGGRSDDTLPPL